MKNIIRTLAGVVLLSVVQVGQAGEIVAIPEYLLKYFTMHKGVAGKNKGTGGSDYLLTGNKRRAGARKKNGTVDIRAGAGNDYVFADWAMRKIKQANTSPYEWGKWGCDPNKKTCLIREQMEVRQGVIAYMGSGADTFYGTPHGDVAFTGDGNDLLYGYGGNDVLIANGIGEYAKLHGGDGSDLLWNQRIGENTRDNHNQVDHWPGSPGGNSAEIRQDTIIAGPGYDKIYVERFPNNNRAQHITIIGFDPDEDRVVDVLVDGFPAIANIAFVDSLPSPDDDAWDDRDEAIAFYETYLPKINLLGHQFTLSTEAVDLDKASAGAVKRPDAGHATIVWLPLAGQSEITQSDFEGLD